MKKHKGISTIIVLAVIAMVIFLIMYLNSQKKTDLPTSIESVLKNEYNDKVEYKTFGQQIVSDHVIVGYEVKESNDYGYIIFERNEDNMYNLLRIVDVNAMLSRGTDIYTDNVTLNTNNSNETQSQLYLVVLSMNDMLNKVELTTTNSKVETVVIGSPSVTIVEINASNVEYHLFDVKGNILY